MRRTAVVLALAALLGCQPPKNGDRPGPGPAPSDDLVGRLDAEGRTVVLIVDASLSMRDTDPRRFREQGSQLAVALASSRDNVGTVAFGDDAVANSKLAALATKEDRVAHQKRLAGIDYLGKTNYTAALTLAGSMLARAKAPRDAVAIFLTDGENTVGGDRASVLAALVPFIKNGWKVHCIGLGKEAQESALLKEIALRTEGAYYPTPTAEDLVTAFTRILTQVYGLVTVDGGLRPFPVEGGVRRLAFVMTKAAPRPQDSGKRLSTFGRLSRDGAVVDPAAEESVYKYPTQVDPAGDLEALHVDRPAPGTWEAGVVDGSARLGMILYQPDFSLELDDGFPAAEYYEGEDVEVSLRVAGNEQVLERVRQGGRGKVILQAEDGRPIGELDLAKTGDNPVRFTGRLAAPGAKGLAQAVVRFTLDDGAGGSWTHEKRATIRFNPGRRPVTLAVTPEALDLGTRWSGAEGPSGEITIAMKGTAGAELSVVPSSDKVVATPATLRLGPGETARVRVTASAAAAGTFAESVRVSGVQAGGNPVTSAPVSVKWKILGVTAPDSLPPVNVAQGKEFRIPLPLDASGGALEVTVGDAAGASGTVPVKLVEEGGKRFLVGTVPADAAGGEYRGAVKVGVAGESAPPRSIPYTLVVGEAVPTIVPGTKALAITAKKSGWSEAEFSFDVEFPRASAVAFACAELSDGKGGKIDATFRQQVKPATAGWDGKSLAPKGTYAAKYRVSISNDLAPGTYAGKLSLVVSDGARRWTTEIPVTVEYKPE